MSDWTAGYVADIGYTFGYYQELNPHRIKLAFLSNRLVCPDVGVACELGFGQGLSANIHAAASVTTWYGTDFNPSQAGFAQELGMASGAPVHLYDEAFADFCHRSDLPEFDYIGLHGIWSWISDENRAVIVDFIRRKLKVGGVLYISYNTLPGWAAFAPMRHLMTEHAEIIGAGGRGIVSRINDAIEFADKLLQTNPLFSRANPLVGDRIGKLKEQNRHYLAHEYFNRDWHPMHFSTMADWLSPAKVQFACSAHYLDHIDAINLSNEQQAFLEEIPDAMFRESVRDFMVNQQFRRDYWVKGTRRLSTVEQSEALRKQCVVLVTHRADVSLKLNGALGEANMSDVIYNPVLDLMADHQTRSLQTIEQALAGRNISSGQLLEVIQALIGAGHLVPTQDDTMVSKTKSTVNKLNDTLINKARGSSEVSYVASPVTGGGTMLGRFQQLFLLARKQGIKDPLDSAKFVWNILAMQSQKIVKDGRTLDSADDNIAELTAQAKLFAEKQLPVLRALQVA